MGCCHLTGLDLFFTAFTVNLGNSLTLKAGESYKKKNKKTIDGHIIHGWLMETEEFIQEETFKE